MDSERWQKIKDLFDAALQIEPTERAKFLDTSCADDFELREEVQKLIDSFDDAESFIEGNAAVEAASLMLELNQTLQKGHQFAHYEIQKQIGTGGMGQVYLADDTKLDRQVAIKILNPEFSQHDSNLQRFIREAKAASSLNHPNILVIHEIGAAADTNYIVSEYVEGKTLRDVIAHSQLKLFEILDISIQISSALVAAHRANIVHRDIKPENVIVRPDGYIKVLDFGLAKLLIPRSAGLEASTVKHNETAKGIILGTVNYMSPEQAKAERVDERTDIFSLGVVIYELVAGRTPFRGASMSETFANLINIEPQPLARYAASVPEELDRIVTKSLRKDKEDRYQSIKDLNADLKELRESLEFDRRLERSEPYVNKEETAILQPATTSTNQDTDEARIDTTSTLLRRRPFTVIALSVLLISLLAAGYFFLMQKSGASQIGARRSLAVLPFINLSQDPNAEYLSDGITESVINNLSQLSGLKVMSRNSAFRFKSDQSDVKRIALQLGVESLVTGDIKQLGDKLIINVRLINADDESQIWGNQYVRNSTDVLRTQGEIATAVAQNLRLKLTNTDAERLTKRYTDNAEAWELYQRGRFLIFKLTPAEVQQGNAYFQKAIDIDPSYALAYAGLSAGYRSLALGSEINPAANIPKSKAAAQKAIELDSSLSDAYTALAISLFWGDWDWSGAEVQFKRALELNPNDVNAHLFYAHLLSNVGRHDEALAEARRARELDPLLPFLGALEGQFLFHAGRLDEALERLQTTFELAPNFWMPHLFASAVYFEKGMFEEAIVEAEKASQLSPTITIPLAYKSSALAKVGRTEEARADLNKLLAMSQERTIPPSTFAQIYYSVGETDKALDWLEKAYAERDPKMTFLKVGPYWNPMRSEPRFIELMRKMNF